MADWKENNDRSFLKERQSPTVAKPAKEPVKVRCVKCGDRAMFGRFCVYCKEEEDG